MQTAYEKGGVDKISFDKFKQNESNMAFVSVMLPANELVKKFENSHLLTVFEFGDLKAVCLKTYKQTARARIDELIGNLALIGMNIEQYFNLEPEMRNTIKKLMFPLN